MLSLSGSVSCNEFLVADNPGAVEEPDVNNPAYVTLIANGAVFALQNSLDDVAYWNGQLADEIFNREVFIEEGQIDRRELYPEMTYITAFTYSPMQRARFLGEDAAKRLKLVLGDTASRDLRVARSLAYAGMAYVYLGEMNCVTPIDMGVPKTPEEIFADAITRFEEAITIANAAKAFLQSQLTPNANAIAATDSVRNLALVGAARAALNRNEKPRATTFASQVPASFDFREYYSDNTTGQLHRTYNRLTQGSSGNLLNTPFQAMAGDPRVPRVAGTAAPRGGVPLSPPSYGTYNGTVAGAPFAPVMSFRIASGLEAQYIIAEADGPTAATNTFVNDRRAVGLQAPVTLTGDPLMAELRDQRSRDFYLDNHRLGDLRRYKKYYNVDLFPKGPYPGSTSGQIYNESIDCWPLSRSEIDQNPNIPKG
jgi:SusD/RagB-like outer membrane lipoprotein